MGCCYLQAELGGLLSDELDLLLAVSLLVVFRTFVDVLSDHTSAFDKAVGQAGEPWR